MDAAWAELASWGNLLASYQLAARGKRGDAAVARFEYRLGERLLRLQQALRSGSWSPGPYVNFTIHEPKRRLISAAPFADRIVHHALVRVIEPRFERSFIGDSYANRIGKGTHAAVDRLQVCCTRLRFVLRLDVRQHFPSVDHQILTERLFKRVHEPSLRRLIEQIIASGADVHDEAGTPELFDGDDLFALCRPRGLPIGNLTSQFWSNCYLDPLDQFIKRGLRCESYLRYVDDFALFGDDKATLNGWCRNIEDFLGTRLRLRVHPESAQVKRCADGVPWLGFVVFPKHRRIKARKVVQACRRLRASNAEHLQGAMPFAVFDAQVQGWINHVRHADSWGLREHVLQQLPLNLAVPAATSVAALTTAAR